MDPVSLSMRSAAAAASRGAATTTTTLADRPVGEEGAGVTFSERIESALAEANTTMNDAEQKARATAEGKGDIVETVLALSKAELSLRHLVTLRNRVFDAYQEIMRLQL